MVVGAAASLAIGLADSASAQDHRSLGDILKGHPRASAPPPVARYGAEQGPAFVLDLSTGTPLLKYENSDEVWVLQSRPAGRGDTVYVNDAGETVLRSSRLGGLTMFTDSRPEGVAVSLRGDANPISAVAAMTPAQFVRRMQDALLRLERVVKRENVTIQFKAQAVSAPLVAEAARLAVDAIAHVSDKANAATSRLIKVVVSDGPIPGVAFTDGVLSITVNSEMGVAGRPSSERIERALH